MKLYRIITTSACGLDYYERPLDHIDILYGNILIREHNGKITKLRDVENICALGLQSKYENGLTDIHYQPPSSDTIRHFLAKRLSEGYQKLFIIASPQLECQHNFAEAVAHLPEQAQQRITIYNSISAGFCTSILAFSARKLLDQQQPPHDICSQLATLEHRSIFFYTSLDLTHAPHNALMDTLRQDFPPKGNYPLAKIIGYDEQGYQTQKIANLPDKDALIERLATEIQAYSYSKHIYGFIVCPCNHELSRWFCETLSKHLNSEKTLISMPIMPEHLMYMGSESFAVRVYHPDDHELVDFCAPD